RSDLNFALKFLLCLDMFMNPFFVTDFSISDSLKTVRKSVLIYETIIMLQWHKEEVFMKWYDEIAHRN
ncbi:MAG: hypothetical protein MR594_05495, partial [Lachnospiraceae bacterium]|nr:hypothetical protein [Lachnospiraceae bacterium]